MSGANLGCMNNPAMSKFRLQPQRHIAWVSNLSVSMRSDKDPRKDFLLDVEKVLGGIKAQYVGRAGSWQGQIGNKCEGTWVVCLMVTMDERDLSDLGHNASTALKHKVQGLKFWHKKILVRNRNWRVKPVIEPSGEGPVDMWLVWWAQKWERPGNGINDGDGHWTGAVHPAS